MAAALCGALLLAGCSAGGGASDGGGTVTPPADDGTLPQSIGISSVAAGDGSVQVRWEASDPAGSTVLVALFSGPSESALYTGVPTLPAGNERSLVLAGLPNGQELFFGLAVPATPGSPQGGWTPVGEIVSATPGAPIYVDAASTAVSPDGLSPATAFDSPIAGVLTALVGGGGNVWVAAGEYENVSLPVFAGVDLYGGFGSAFDLAARDPALHPTRLRGQAGRPVLELDGGGARRVVDGFELEGDDLANFGVDLDGTAAELRSLVIGGCIGHGVRARSSATGPVVRVKLVRCAVLGNNGGVSVDGAFDLAVHGSRFSSNRIEGLELGGLVAPEGQEARLVVHASDFIANGNEGLDCDLLPPLIPGPGGGLYTVRIAGCRFERNGGTAAASSSSGLNLDIDFELVPGWRARIELEGCAARSNRGHGVRMDLDSFASVLVRGLVSSANGADGLAVSSESTPGIAVVTGSAFTGNAGYGLRASLGNVPVLASHCAFAGNAAGGLRSEVLESSLVSSAGWLQPQLAAGTLEHFNVTSSDPAAPLFLNAPVAFARVTGQGSGTVTLADASALAPGDWVEVADDGEVRGVTGLHGGQQVSLDPAPAALSLPTGLGRFEGADVTEDWRPSPASLLLGAGMPDPAAGPRDAGPFGAPGATAPGELGSASPRFYPSDVSPTLDQPLTSGSDIQVMFEGGALDGLSVSTLAVRALDATGSALGIAPIEQAGSLLVPAPTGGWPAGRITLELHGGLRSVGGADLVAPIAIPLQVP